MDLYDQLLSFGLSEVLEHEGLVYISTAHLIYNGSIFFLKANAIQRILIAGTTFRRTGLYVYTLCDLMGNIILTLLLLICSNLSYCDNYNRQNVSI